MSCDKGKGRTHDDEAASHAQPDGPQDLSIASRIAVSATGLARSALASPNGNEVNQSAAAALASSGKGQAPSPGGSSAWSETSMSTQQPTSQPSSSNALRPSQNEEHIRQSEIEFSSFLDGIDSFTPSDNRPESLEAGFGEAWSRSHPLNIATPLKAARYGTVIEQEHHDGEEVLAILSTPGAMNVQFEAPPQDDENYDWGLTAEQLTELRAMTKDILPPPEPHQDIAPNHPLNLVPHIDDTDSIDASSQAAVDAWRDQWQTVLTRYTDEVWGGMLPLVREARKEIEDMQNGDPRTTQPKALRRLGAVLGHLRKY